MLNAIFVMNPDFENKIYDFKVVEAIEKLVKIKKEIVNPKDIANYEMAESVDIIFASWGMPRLDGIILERYKRLKIIFYGAGTIKGFVTDELWNRNIRVTSAYAANSIPVAEFSFAQIILSLKRYWEHSDLYKKEKRHAHLPVAGCYGTKVGLVSLGMIGKKVAGMLKLLEIETLVYDPFISATEAEELGAQLCTLDYLFKNSDVISIHTPWLKETENLINGELINSMKENSTLINTSRGAVVNEVELINVLSTRKDIYALLDVTWPEPCSPDSPMFKMENVVLTPHIEGSMDSECKRMGEYMYEELEKYLKNQPLKWEIKREQINAIA